jgi:hypothetical protein
MCIVPVPLLSLILTPAEHLNSSQVRVTAITKTTGKAVLKPAHRSESTTKQQVPLFINCLFILQSEQEELSPRKQAVILNFVNLRSAARSRLILTNLKVKSLIGGARSCESVASSPRRILN